MQTNETTKLENVELNACVDCVSYIDYQTHMATLTDYEKVLVEFGVYDTISEFGFKHLALNYDSWFYSWKPCDICCRKLGGNRLNVIGVY